MWLSFLSLFFTFLTNFKALIPPKLILEKTDKGLRKKHKLIHSSNVATHGSAFLKSVWNRSCCNVENRKKWKKTKKNLENGKLFIWRRLIVVLYAFDCLHQSLAGVYKGGTVGQIKLSSAMNIYMTENWSSNDLVIFI